MLPVFQATELAAGWRYTTQCVTHMVSPQLRRTDDMGVTHGYGGARTMPDAGRGVRQEPLCHAEARLWSIPATAVLWSHTADGVSAGCLAGDTGAGAPPPCVVT